ncbi:MAG TPA: His/Gly/Thr/Pro-type tRNA ligase C-terminal domain-containing protein, partial [Pyrinomonadaceae bacterium]|nr:His/Gly/Thr/Pro-type tRNA ligase C-terminal domain-containing protein [Pyrinomonadaceae bacterium]
FDVNYIGEDGERHRAVMIHRTLLGSMERFVGGLVEHYAGAFPMWLAPVQVAVLPITDRVNEYADELARELRVAGFRVEANLRSEKIGAKIRDAQLQKVPFMLVLGDREMEQKTVAVRERARGDIGVMSIAEFKEMARRLVETRALTNN